MVARRAVVRVGGRAGRRGSAEEHRRRRAERRSGAVRSHREHVPHRR